MHVVPLVFFNLGGEMLYVLDQRLRAQNIAQGKGKKVMADIVTTMFKTKFTDQLMQPQTMYSRHAVRSMFDKLVHSSIMTIESESMDKLYDLMVMAFKYEVLQCAHPKDLIHITLNHFDTIIKFVPLKSEAHSLVLQMHKNFVKIYGDMPIGDLVMMRHLLLAFLQDAKNKVSVFINSKTQNHDGHFVTMTHGAVAKDTDVPGVIRYFKKELKDETFSTGCNFSSVPINLDVSMDIGGKRSTKLGCNLYANDCTLGHDVVKNSYQSSNQHLAKAELNLLAFLMGSNDSTLNKNQKEFELNIFNKPNADFKQIEKKDLTKKREITSNSNVVNVPVYKTENEALSKIMSDFSIDSPKQDKNTEEDDLLALMDNAS